MAAAQRGVTFAQAGEPREPAPAAPYPDAKRQLASLPFAVLLLAPGGAIAAANPAAEQILGQSQRRLAGRPLGEALRFADADIEGRIDGADAMLIARGLDAVIIGQGARRIDLSLAGVIDQPGWQVLTIQDSQNADAGNTPNAEEAMAMRGPEVLAHEIKNPLAGIRGAAQLLARKLRPEDAGLTTLIADEVDRIARLIDQMQTLSRQTPEPLAPCNLHEAVRRAVAVLAAGGRVAGVEEQFDPSLPAVMGSANALVQVLINLIANAHEAASAAPNPRVIVRTRFASGLQMRGANGPVRLPIELRISDNGAGVDPALRDHIFEPFVTGKRNGQGLGLALVRKLARDMNGHITHDREEARQSGADSWTHFRLHLPQAPAIGIGIGRDAAQ